MTDMDTERVGYTRKRFSKLRLHHRTWWIIGIIVLGTGVVLLWPPTVRSPIHAKWFLMLPRRGVEMYVGRDGLYSIEAGVLAQPETVRPNRTVKIGENDVKSGVGAFGFRFGDAMPTVAGVKKWRAVCIASAFTMNTVTLRNQDQWLTVTGTSRGISDISAYKIPFDFMGHRFTPGMSIHEVKRNLAG